MTKIIKNLQQLISSNSLLKNAINLMISAGVTALFGFVFWIAVANTFDSEAVGLATTLLSMSALISLLGLAGFDTVFVRFLPKSKNRNEYINSGAIISGIASAILAAGFCLLIPLLSPKLGFVNSNPLYILSFIFFTVLATWNTLTNAIFVAYRKTSYVVVINIIFSGLKMALPFVITHGGPMTIFIFTGVAQLVNVAISVIALMRHFDYKPSLKIHFAILKESRKYGLSVYTSNILNLLPDSALPLIVINNVGASAAAFFYIAFTIANLLYTIVFATNQALLAEAAHEEGRLKGHVLRGLKISAFILIPITIIVVIFCPVVLAFFGKDYQYGAVGILRIMAISSFAIILYSLLSFIFKHTKNLAGMLIMTSVNATAIIVLAIIFSKQYGLIGVGWAWLIGTVLAVIAGCLTLLWSHKKVVSA